MITGCGKKAAKVSSDSDNCIVVQTPEGSTVEELFEFKQKNKLHCQILEMVLQQYTV